MDMKMEYGLCRNFAVGLDHVQSLRFERLPHYVREPYRYLSELGSGALVEGPDV